MYNAKGVVITPTIAFPNIIFIFFIGDINDSITKRTARNNELNNDGINTSILLYFKFRKLRTKLIIVRVKNAVKNPIKRPLTNLKDNAFVVVISTLIISIKDKAITSNNIKIKTNK